ncbi:MAG: hypothetical protein GYB31_18480 [Bacteroidetes bacterium]|nr:hypothetical protein [Bacteroidota bacterium]
MFIPLKDIPHDRGEYSAKAAKKSMHTLSPTNPQILPEAVKPLLIYFLNGGKKVLQANFFSVKFDKNLSKPPFYQPLDWKHNP